MGEQSRVLHEMAIAAGETGVNKELLETKRQKRTAAILNKKGNDSESGEGRDDSAPVASSDSRAKEEGDEGLGLNHVVPSNASTGGNERHADNDNEKFVTDIVYESKERNESKEALAALEREEIEEKEQHENGNDNSNSHGNVEGRGIEYDGKDE